MAEETPQPITDDSQLFGIGDEISAVCPFAWPPAPTYITKSITTTMHRPELPQLLLFGKVTYPIRGPKILVVETDLTETP